MVSFHVGDAAGVAVAAAGKVKAGGRMGRKVRSQEPESEFASPTGRIRWKTAGIELASEALA